MNHAGAYALHAWLLSHPFPTPWGEVVVRAIHGGHEVRHVADSQRDDGSLLLLQPRALLEWADTTAQGAFRPLKSAPTLRSGWRCIATNQDDLALALEGLYPGALGDWWAWQQGSATPTSFQDFMGRQAGIYRNIRNLPAADADSVTRACCSTGSCLKTRLWPVLNTADASHPPDSSTAPPRPGIPCWEPCALLMDMARTAARLASVPSVTLNLPPDDLPVLMAALTAASSLPASPDVRDAELSNPANPRRMRLLLERLRRELCTPQSSSPS